MFIIFIFSFGNWGYLFRKGVWFSSFKMWGSLMQKAGGGLLGNRLKELGSGRGDYWPGGYLVLKMNK